MVILDPELEERTVTPSLETYLKIIKDSGGLPKTPKPLHLLNND
jgi:ribosomal protein S6